MVSPSADVPSKRGKDAVPCSTLRSALLTNFLTPPSEAPAGATARLTATAEAATAARTRVRLLVFLRAINLFSLLRRGRTCGRYGLHSPFLSVARYTSGRKRWPRSSFALTTQGSAVRTRHRPPQTCSVTIRPWTLLLREGF